MSGKPLKNLESLLLNAGLRSAVGSVMLLQLQRGIARTFKPLISARRLEEQFDPTDITVLIFRRQPWQ
jgi:hypothetical protein